MIRKLASCVVASVAALAGATGCATQVAPLSSHTIQVAPNQEADVLWMLKGGRLVRCTGQGGKPSCTEVETR